MRLFLARHGETTWNLEHRLQGRADTPLTDRGRAQARALAALLADEPLAAVYASPLQRAAETARPLALRRGLVPELRPELVEIGYGVLEGRTADDPDAEIRALFAARKRDPIGFRPPGGGETYAELRDRLVPFVAELQGRHAGETVAVIGHRGTNRVLYGLLLGLPLEDCMAFKQKHDRVVEIRPGRVPDCVSHRYAPFAAKE